MSNRGTRTARTEDTLLVAAREELRRGQQGPACARIDELILAVPDNAEAFQLKGLMEAHRQMWGEAAYYFQRALAASPTNASWLRDLGSVLAAQGDWPGAVRAFSQALASSPEDHRSQSGYGRALLELNLSAKAIPYLEQALQQRESVSVMLSLARALAAENRFEKAVEVLERAIAVDPARVELYRTLGTVAAECRVFELARHCWEKVLTLTPDDPDAETQLIRIRWELGDLRFTIDAIEKKIREGSASEEVHSFWLYIQLYDKLTSSQRRRLCEDFARRVTPPRIRQFNPRREVVRANTKLRIGYLGGEFVSGPPFYFASPLLGNHNLRDFDIFLYHSRRKHDAGTEWYKGLANWRDCHDLDDGATRDLIDRDGIQILVDLSAFFPDNRLRIFAGRAAPVQVTYPNCPTSTGVAQIDYIFTDRWTCGRGQESQYTEQPVFLPSGYLVYAPASDCPPVTELPALRNGFVTFGIFQRRAKMRPEFWDAVGEILRKVPGSRLLVHNYDSGLDDSTTRNYALFMAELAARGIPQTRVSLRGHRPHREALDTMAEADIALDTFPYQGQTTTCECLWQGVPIIALSGDVHVSRVGSALLQRAGLQRYVAQTQRDYVRKAVRFASDLASLGQLRAGMRDRLTHSNLLDGALLARNVEGMYRRMWRAWCEGETLATSHSPMRRRQNGESGHRRTRE